MIRLCDIRKTYKTRHGSVEVLNGISLTVPDHTLVMLLGESGSGKSTLCNILGLLDTPTAGEYYLDDTPIHTLSQKERTDLRREKVSFVFQSFNLIPTMTAWENIELPLGYRHFSKSERDARVETVLRSVGLIGTIRPSCREGNSSVSPSRGHWLWSRLSSSRTNRLGTWTKARRGRSWRHCWKPDAARRYSWSRTTKS